jgi:DNA polymerase III epsilon subunit-like protein
VIFDLETTGLKSNKVPVDIVEIAAIKFSKKGLKEKLVLAMNQDQLAQALEFEKIFRQYYDRQSYTYG